MHRQPCAHTLDQSHRLFSPTNPFWAPHLRLSLPVRTVDLAAGQRLFLGRRARSCRGDDFQRRPIKGPIDEEALTIFAQFEDADEVDEACEGAWVVAGFGGDTVDA